MNSLVVWQRIWLIFPLYDTVQRKRTAMAWLRNSTQKLERCKEIYFQTIPIYSLKVKNYEDNNTLAVDVDGEVQMGFFTLFPMSRYNTCRKTADGSVSRVRKLVWRVYHLQTWTYKLLISISMINGDDWNGDHLACKQCQSWQQGSRYCIAPVCSGDAYKPVCSKN